MECEKKASVDWFWLHVLVVKHALHFGPQIWVRAAEKGHSHQRCESSRHRRHKHPQVQLDSHIYGVPLIALNGFEWVVLSDECMRYIAIAGASDVSYMACPYLGIMSERMMGIFTVKSRSVVLKEAQGEPKAEETQHKVYFGAGWHDVPVLSFSLIWFLALLRTLLSFSEQKQITKTTNKNK